MKDTPASTCVTERIRMFILQRFPLARSRQLHCDEPLLERGIIDSLGVLEVVGYLEREFRIIISDDDLSPVTFRSIESLAEFVTSRLDDVEG